MFILMASTVDVVSNEFMLGQTTPTAAVELAVRNLSVVRPLLIKSRHQLRIISMATSVAVTSLVVDR